MKEKRATREKINDKSCIRIITADAIHQHELAC